MKNISCDLNCKCLSENISNYLNKGYKICTARIDQNKINVIHTNLYVYIGANKQILWGIYLNKDNAFIRIDFIRIDFNNINKVDYVLRITKFIIKNKTNNVCEAINDIESYNFKSSNIILEHYYSYKYEIHFDLINEFNKIVYKKIKRYYRYDFDNNNYIRSVDVTKLPPSFIDKIMTRINTFYGFKHANATCIKALTLAKINGKKLCCRIFLENNKGYKMSISYSC